MELSEPDPDIHVDVDLMILDYLLCMTLESILSAGQVRSEENGEHNSIDSSIATIYGMRPQTDNDTRNRANINLVRRQRSSVSFPTPRSYRKIYTPNSRFSNWPMRFVDAPPQQKFYATMSPSAVPGTRDDDGLVWLAS
jgi:hypothetical protein